MKNKGKMEEVYFNRLSNKHRPRPLKHSLTLAGLHPRTSAMSRSLVLNVARPQPTVGPYILGGGRSARSLTSADDTQMASWSLSHLALKDSFFGLYLWCFGRVWKIVFAMLFVLFVTGLWKIMQAFKRAKKPPDPKGNEDTNPAAANAKEYDDEPSPCYLPWVNAVSKQAPDSGVTDAEIVGYVSRVNAIIEQTPENIKNLRNSGVTDAAIVELISLQQKTLAKLREDLLNRTADEGHLLLIQETIDALKTNYNRISNPMPVAQMIEWVDEIQEHAEGIKGFAASIKEAAIVAIQSMSGPSPANKGIRLPKPHYDLVIDMKDFGQDWKLFNSMIRGIISGKTETDNPPDYDRLIASLQEFMKKCMRRALQVLCDNGNMQTAEVSAGLPSALAIKMQSLSDADTAPKPRFEEALAFRIAEKFVERLQNPSPNTVISDCSHDVTVKIDGMTKALWNACHTIEERAGGLPGISTDDGEVADKLRTFREKMTQLTDTLAGLKDQELKVIKHMISWVRAQIAAAPGRIAAAEGRKSPTHQHLFDQAERRVQEGWSPIVDISQLISLQQKTLAKLREDLLNQTADETTREVQLLSEDVQRLDARVRRLVTQDLTNNEDIAEVLGWVGQIQESVEGIPQFVAWIKQAAIVAVQSVLQQNMLRVHEHIRVPQVHYNIIIDTEDFGPNWRRFYPFLKSISSPLHVNAHQGLFQLVKDFMLSGLKVVCDNENTQPGVDDMAATEELQVELSYRLAEAFVERLQNPSPHTVISDASYDVTVNTNGITNALWDAHAAIEELRIRLFVQDNAHLNTIYRPASEQYGQQGFYPNFPSACDGLANKMKTLSASLTKALGGA
eukprot:GHVQ01015026.1.p1 GENE.GHVQ01015026.1~~GHVQ01015026.1.p1  ORF type:complete len:846 (+),score=63.66 GHVQ01015026.1:448-2985(+)